MNYRMVVNLLGRTLLCVAALLAVPIVVALIYGESAIGFIVAAVIACSIGLACIFIKPKTKAIYAREGFLVVSLSWVLLSLIGCLPFVIDKSIPNFVDALFETVSGLTTTGGTILVDIEAMGYADMFWRCFTHWIGGMGVLVFILAIMPTLSDEQPMYLMRAEVPGPTVGKIVPKIRTTARILYTIYIVLTLIEVVFLLFGGVSLFDALIHSFSTAGTGGFSSWSDSIAHFSPYVQYVIAIFMLIFATNFNLHYLVIIRNFKDAFRDEEMHWFYGIAVISTLVISINIFPQFSNAESSFRHALFQVASLMSSTGYSTADFNTWPEFSKTILMLLVIFGSCAGSTGGGIKISRLVIMVKSITNEIKHLLHPRSINVIRLNRKPVEVETLRSIYVFFVAYILILIISTVLISFDGFDFTTNLTASMACLGNTGPGLSLVGPMGSYAAFSPLSKIVLSFVMLFGRLEIFPMAILFLPSVWKR